MNANLSFFLKILAVIVFVLSCLWSYYNFGFEPVIAAVGSLITLIGLMVSERFSKNKSGITQNQRAGDNSQNYQASGNININQKDND